MKSVWDEKTVKLVKFGNGGSTVYYSRHHTCSGYDRPETWKPGSDIVPDGCPVVDVRAAVETPSGYRWVFNGPMVDVDLESGIDRCPQPSALMATAMISGGSEFGQLMLLQAVSDPSEAGPLDSVDIATYLDGWREHGARTGQVLDGAIVWD